MAKRKVIAAPAPDWAANAVAVAHGAESIEIEDANGNRVTVTLAHWQRWHAALSPLFRPVAETPDLTGSIQPPTGDKTEEN